uniref:Uncharacterized protein n=1 Tax=Lotus japonicus TaxID=34305 RepID=I3SDY2_LOTJA|nr:unknown [Lotus japonicus]
MARQISIVLSQLVRSLVSGKNQRIVKLHWKLFYKVENMFVIQVMRCTARLVC